MLLIDALYINNSGGLELLKYLICSLESQCCDVFYLLDKRCCNEFRMLDKRKRLFLKASLLNRFVFYLKKRYFFDKILCFGNIPPPITTNAIVYCYFHNINLLKIPFEVSLKSRILMCLKQKYIYMLKCNTNFWIAQTENTKNEINRILRIPTDYILLYPFFDIGGFCLDVQNGKDYVYVANYNYSKNHLLLVKAWRKLHHLGYSLTLHLTLSDCPKELKDEIEFSIHEGVKIVNHGYIASKTDLFLLYMRSKATVYPSKNESFGLGIIEALSCGCDLIGPDLSYIHSVCVPSSVFSSFSVDDLVTAITKYENQQCPHSVLTIENKIRELIKIIS